MSEIEKVVVFSIDENFAHHLAAALNSILENNKTVIQVVVLSFNLSPSSLEAIQRFQKGCIAKLSLIEMEESRFVDLHTTPRFTRAAYGRFLVPNKILTNSKVLYLDADVIILRDLGEIFEIDLMEYPVAGIANIDEMALANLLGEECQGNYLDSGCLLFNLRKWRQDDITAKITKNVLMSGESWSTPDNHGLNVVLRGNFLQLPMRFSYQTRYFNSFPHTQGEGVAATILQFAGPVKPDSYLCLDIFKPIYAYHLQRTPFADFLDADKNLKNLIKRFVSERKARG